MVIRVGIVEDQCEIREGLAILIGASAGFCCTGAWGGMEQALPAIKANPPDVVLVDIELPGMSGIEGIRTLNKRQPKLLLLVIR